MFNLKNTKSLATEFNKSEFYGYSAQSIEGVNNTNNKNNIPREDFDMSLQNSYFISI